MTATHAYAETADHLSRPVILSDDEIGTLLRMVEHDICSVRDLMAAVNGPGMSPLLVLRERLRSALPAGRPL